MQNLWLYFTLTTMFLWGLWGFFSKMATTFLRDMDATIYQAFGYLFVTGVAAFVLRFQGGGKPIGIFYAVLSGASAALATFFFFGAITRGRSVVVVSMTALYPLITLGLSAIFLHEMLTLKQLLGVGMAVGAIVLLSS